MFLIATLDNKLHKLKINLNSSLEVSPVIINLPDGYTSYGLSGTENNAFVVLAAFATKPFDHLVLREPASVFFYKWSHTEPLQELIDNPTLSFNGFMDYVEMVRYLSAKDYKVYKAYENRIQKLLIETNVDDHKFYYLIKIAILLNSAMYTCLRFRGDAELKTTVDIEQCLEELFVAFTSKNALTGNGGNQLHVNNIKDYLKSEPSLKVYQIIQKKMKNTLENLIKTTAKRYKEKGPGECAYCTKQIPFDSLKCEDGHKARLCCITMVQLKFDLVSCPQCFRVASKDLDLSEVKCTLCDISFNDAYKS